MPSIRFIFPVLLFSIIEFIGCHSETTLSPLSPPQDSILPHKDNPEDSTQQIPLSGINATERYQSGDGLFVFAKSGLHLRKEPEISSDKIATVPFKSLVTVIGKNLFEHTYQIEDSCGMNIKGYWVKVRFGELEGYLFDAYLLKYKPQRSFEDFITYWTTISFLRSTTDEIPPNDRELIGYHEDVWENGVRFLEESQDGGSSWTITLPSSLFTFQDAYIYATNSLWAFESNFTCTCKLSEYRVDCYNEADWTNISMNKHGDFEIDLGSVP